MSKELNELLGRDHQLLHLYINIQQDMHGKHVYRKLKDLEQADTGQLGRQVLESMTSCKDEEEEELPGCLKCLVQCFSRCFSTKSGPKSTSKHC